MLYISVSGKFVNDKSREKYPDIRSECCPNNINQPGKNHLRMPLV